MEASPMNKEHVNAIDKWLDDGSRERDDGSRERDDQFREPLNITKVPVMKNVEPSRGAFKYAHKDNGGKNDGKSYVNVVKSNEKPGSGECVDNPKALKPSLVLDDSCENDSDFTLSLNGKLKDFGWAPSFNDEGDLDSDDESVNSQNACSLKEEIFDKHSDVEEIPETEFVKPEHVRNSSPISIRIHKEAREAEKSEDPFLIFIIS
ncbi:hypothetical protein Tco_0924875 [Tanacetum coccineum]|uniref:Uncharacterized protein n=1 Tax=Tanacetum coccineum TaxID=301880 RepID=A0ABQ5D895_9ASTR